MVYFCIEYKKKKSGLADISTIQNSPIKTQLSLQLQVQLDQEKRLNDHYNKYLAEQLNAIEENFEGITMTFTGFVKSTSFLGCIQQITIKMMTFIRNRL